MVTLAYGPARLDLDSRPFRAHGQEDWAAEVRARDHHREEEYDQPRPGLFSSREGKSHVVAPINLVLNAFPLSTCSAGSLACITRTSTLSSASFRVTPPTYMRTQLRMTCSPCGRPPQWMPRNIALHTRSPPRVPSHPSAATPRGPRSPRRRGR